MDGNVFSGNRVIAGAYPTDAAGQPITAGDFRFTQINADSVLVDYSSIRFTLMENGIKIIADEDFTLESRVGKTDRHFPALVSCSDKTLRLRYKDMDYGIQIIHGHFNGAKSICSEDGIIELNFI